MGLGAWIVRRLAELLQHRVELVYARPRLALLDRVAAGGARRRRRPQDTAEPETATSAAPDFAGLCVVVLDDDPAVLAGTRALIESRGGRVIAAGSAAGLPLEPTDRDAAAIDLIVADLRLAEGRSGLTEIARLRRRAGRPIPALIVSGDTGDEARAEVAAHGIPLLAKPLVAVALEDTLREMLPAA